MTAPVVCSSFSDFSTKCGAAFEGGCCAQFKITAVTATTEADTAVNAARAVWETANGGAKFAVDQTFSFCETKAEADTIKASTAAVPDDKRKVTYTVSCLAAPVTPAADPVKPADTTPAADPAKPADTKKNSAVKAAAAMGTVFAAAMTYTM